MKDLRSNIGVVQMTAPGVHTATQTSAAVDLQGFNSVAVVINTGAVVGGGFTGALHESDEPSSDFTLVGDGDLLGAFPAAIDADTVVTVGYKGSKRYIRTVLTKEGTSTASGVLAVLGHPWDAPVA